jgi:hypothetical protein
MADCTANPEYLLRISQCALSPTCAKVEFDALHKIAPNPFPDGRARMEHGWRSLWAKHAARLVWC